MANLFSGYGKKIIYGTAAVFLSLSYFSTAFAARNSIHVIQRVTGACNHNGLCEADIGEDIINCLSDCIPAIPSVNVPVGGQSPVSPAAILNSRIENITLNSADVAWETDRAAICRLYWGGTEEYEKGGISETGYSDKHGTKIIGLNPAVTYHLKIYCQDDHFQQFETSDRAFTTLIPPDITAPPNVFGFTAGGAEQNIMLKWLNPADYDFRGVRVIRSEKFYPKDQFDGAPIYEGAAESFTDRDVLSGVRYYYTAFSYDAAGNFSSGAVAAAYVKTGTVPEEPVEKTVEVETPETVENVGISQFDFTQDEQSLFGSPDGSFEVEAGKPFDISIGYNELPEVLKTVMVRMEQNGRQFSFLLRINKSKTRYSATIMLPEAGIYPFKITVLDYLNRPVRAKEIKGRFIVKSDTLSQVSNRNSVQAAEAKILAAALLLAALYLLAKGIGKLRAKNAKTQRKKAN